MTAAPELFSPLGGIRKRAEYNEAEIEGMSPERRRLFDALYASVEGEQLAEQTIKDALEAISVAATAVDTAKAKLWQYRPARTFHDEWLVMTGKVPQFTPDEKTAAAIKVAERELIVAEENFAFAKETHAAALQAVKPARGRVATALAHYTATFPVKTGTDAVHDHIRGETKRRAQNIAEGRRAEDNGARQAHGPSVLDQVRAGGRGSAGFSRNIGRRPGTYPGTSLGQKVQSER